MNSGLVRVLGCPRTGTRRRAAAVLLAVTLAGLGVPLAAGTATAATADGVASGSADLAVAETVSSATPYYYTSVTFTTTVTNTSTTSRSYGISVTAAAPAGLIKRAETPSQGTYHAKAGTWTVGSLARGASATLTISGFAGAVALGTQTVTATATATTPDPNPGNNTASASEASQPATLAAVITPSPNNPNPIDISQPGDVSWTGSSYNLENPAAPAPFFRSAWVCSTASGVECPPAAGTSRPNVRTLTYVVDTLSVDAYTITLAVSPTNGNYVGNADSLTFTTTNSGG
jgi:hypothetical protein